MRIITATLGVFLAGICQEALAAGAPTKLSVPASITVTEGQSVPLRVCKSGGNGRATTVSYSTADGAANAGLDYAARSGSFSLGSSCVSLSFATTDDSLVEASEGFTVNLSIPSTGFRISTVVYITDNDVAPVPAPTPVPTPTPAPEPTPADEDAPGGANNPLVGQSPGVGAPDIPTTDHDVMQDVTGGHPLASPQPDSELVGAFRFICRHTAISYDDQTVYYQQPGKSAHVHDFTSNYLTNAFSNYGNLRRTGGSGCNDVAGNDLINQPVPAAGTDPKVNWAANRTPYLQAAMLDGRGNIILADLTKFYYKRFPASSAECTQHIRSKMGCAPLPNGIKFLFGANAGNPAQPYGDVDATHPNGIPRFYYFCPAAGQKFDTDLKAAVQCVQAHDTTGVGGELIVQADAPNCWDGIHLDSADHRSHLAYTVDSHLGYTKCPDTHPYYIPAFTYAASYTIMPTDDASLIKLSCDDMDPTKPHGWCFHVDYGPAAWDPVILKMWTDNCIDKKLNCSSGSLGNGYFLKGAAQPIYNVGGVYRSLWKNPVRLVPLSSLGQ